MQLLLPGAGREPDTALPDGLHCGTNGVNPAAEPRPGRSHSPAGCSQSRWPACRAAAGRSECPPPAARPAAGGRGSGEQRNAGSLCKPLSLRVMGGTRRLAHCAAGSRLLALMTPIGTAITARFAQKVLPLVFTRTPPSPYRTLFTAGGGAGRAAGGPNVGGYGRVQGEAQQRCGARTRWLAAADQHARCHLGGWPGEKLHSQQAHLRHPGGCRAPQPAAL